jgi:hypothetical protein
MKVFINESYIKNSDPNNSMNDSFEVNINTVIKYCEFIL